MQPRDDHEVGIANDLAQKEWALWFLTQDVGQFLEVRGGLLEAAIGAFGEFVQWLLQTLLTALDEVVARHRVEEELGHQGRKGRADAFHDLGEDGFHASQHG